MKLIGIDIGRANTGIVIFDLNEKKVQTFTTITTPLSTSRSACNGINPTSHRLYKISLLLSEFIKDNISQEDTCLAIVEDYAYGDSQISVKQFRRMDKMSLEVAEVHGIIYSTLFSYSIPMIKIAPSQLKYFITGDGRCEKTSMIKKMYREYQISMDDDHQYDALSLCHVGRYFILFCKNPEALQAGSYEYNTMVRLVYNSRYTQIAREMGLKM